MARARLEPRLAPAGARSFTAITEWAAHADEQTLRVLGAVGRVPSESTFRRTLQRLDADRFDDLAGAWAQRATRPGPRARRVIAVDGKTLRGSAHSGEDGRHLLAALDHAHGAGAARCPARSAQRDTRHPLGSRDCPRIPWTMRRPDPRSSVIS
jgi:hypothetical protein